jgi:hypothetical protein
MHVKSFAARCFLAALVMNAVPASAAVSFDPRSGTGRVGQSDIAPLFGWTAVQFQQNAAGVTFSYAENAVFSATCMWAAGPAGPGQVTQTVTHERRAAINTALEMGRGPRKAVSGFALGGFGTMQESGEPAPVVGGPCRAGGAMGNFSSVSPLSTRGILNANYGGISVPLPY